MLIQKALNLFALQLLYNKYSHMYYTIKIILNVKRMKEKLL